MSVIAIEAARDNLNGAIAAICAMGAMGPLSGLSQTHV